MPRALRILQLMASATRNRTKYRFSTIQSFSGSTTRTYTPADSAEYVRRVYEDFLQYGDLTPAQIEGRTVVELGPGDNVGVLLRFLAEGATRAWAADKFESIHDLEHERQTYVEIRKQLTHGDQRKRFDDAVNLDGGLKFNPERISYAYGKGAQDVDQVVAAQSVDIVVSRGVLQEVYEIDKAWKAIDTILKPGGVTLHKIDLRDYGMFSSLGYHPREFLTVPGWAYHWIAYDTDKPNRRMLNYYREKMKKMKYDAKFFITGVVQDGGYAGIQPEIFPHPEHLKFGVNYTQKDRDLANEIKPRLASEFQSLTEEELLALATILVAWKPEANGAKSNRFGRV
jgi:hypothetical protein